MQYMVIIYKNGQVDILKSYNGVQWEFVLRTPNNTLIIIEDRRD